MDRRTFWIIGIIALLVVPTAYASASSPVHSSLEIHGNTITVIYNSSSPVEIDPTTPDYVADDETISYGGNDYDATVISNSDNENGGIANENGDVDVSLTLNDPRPFCFEIHHINGENSKLRMVVTVDGITKQYTSNISGNVRHYIGATDKYFGINSFLRANDNAGDWMVSTTGSVSIQITNYNGHVPDNVTFAIIYKPDS